MGTQSEKISNQKTAISIIKEMSGQGNVLAVPRIYIDIMGSIEGGVLLSQIIYWSDKGANGWFYKKMSEWEKETTLSEYKVRKYTDTMVVSGYLQTIVKKDPSGTPVTHYKFDIDTFLDFVSEKFKFPLSKNSRVDSGKISESSITETTKQRLNIGAEKSAPPRRKRVPISHPVNSAFLDEFDFSIPAAARRDVAAAVGDDPDAVERWREVVHHWKMRGFSPKNFSGMLDWFEQTKRGETPWEQKRREYGETSNVSDEYDPASIAAIHWAV